MGRRVREQVAPLMQSQGDLSTRGPSRVGVDASEPVLLDWRWNSFDGINRAVPKRKIGWPTMPRKRPSDRKQVIRAAMPLSSQGQTWTRALTTHSTSQLQKFFVRHTLEIFNKVARYVAHGFSFCSACVCDCRC